MHILTRRASEGSEALPSLARRVRMSFFGARVIACALAALDGTFECIAVVMAASDDEAKDAARNGVTLIRGRSDENWTSVLLLKDIWELEPSTVTTVVGA